MKAYIRTLLAALGRALLDRFEANVNGEPYPTYTRTAPTDTWQRRAAKPINFGRVPPPFPPQIKPPARWHRVSTATDKNPFVVHCSVCKRIAPWELGDPCPGAKS